MISSNPFDFKSVDTLDPNLITSRNANGSFLSTKNQSVSCVACFKRHLDCSSDKPTCSNCLKMNLTCEYLSSRKVTRTHRHKLNYPIAGRVENENQAPLMKKKKIEKDDQTFEHQKKDGKRKINQSISTLQSDPSYILDCDKVNHHHERDDSDYHNENRSRKVQQNPSTSSSSNNSTLIPLVKLLQFESKIYSIYFDLLDHISSVSQPCIVKDNFQLVRNMMTNYIKTNSQLQRISYVFQERIQNMMSRIESLNILHSCEHCVSLDAENDLFDYFSCNSSPTLEAATRKHSPRCALHLMRTNNILNANPYIFLDYTINKALSSTTTTLSSAIRMEDVTSNQVHRTVKPSINKAFEMVFGYNEDQISRYMSHFVDGVLPFCGDLFSLLFEDTNDVKRVMHRFANKISQSFNEYYIQMGLHPTFCFTVETLFEVGTSTNPLRIKNQEGNSSLPCKCQILSRNIFLVGGIYGGAQVHINFVPIESPNSLMKIENSVPNTIQNESSDEDDKDDESWIDSVIGNLIEEPTDFNVSPSPSESTM